MEKTRPQSTPGHSDAGLLIIAIFKLFKGLLLLIVGTGALTLINRDLAEVARGWAHFLHIGVDNRFIRILLANLTDVDNRKLEEISAGLFFYAALLLTEGIGLSLRKLWAEYFSAIVTASFLPLEVYELTRRFSATRILVIAVNVAVVWYLVARIVSERKERIIAAQTTTTRRE